MTDWSTIWATVAVGLAVVFAVLIILVLLVNLFSIIVNFATRKVNARKQKKEQEEINQVKKPVAVKQSEAAPVASESGIPGEVIAAISAAVAVMSESSGKQYAVKSVKRVKEARPAWNMAGITENTRAF